MQFDDEQILKREKELQSIINQYGYWDGHPLYPIEDWKFEVECDDTLMSYWNWVLVMIEEKEWEINNLDELIKEGKIEELPDGSFRSVGKIGK